MIALTRRETALLIVLFVVTRAALVGFGVLVVMTVPSTEGEEFTHLLDGNPALDMWYRWDAGFYTSIATYGYDWVNEARPADDMAFLPLYPALIRAVSGLTPAGCSLSAYWSTCTTIGGLLVSNAALLGATFLLFNLAKRRFSLATAWRAVLLLMITPNMIFLSGVYTESLFLLLCLIVFILLERDRFVSAAVVACFACLTRSVGVALYPALLWAAYRSSSRRPLRIALAHLPPLVFAGYILLMGISVGDPLAYFSAYSATWGRASASPIEAFTLYFTGEPAALFGWWESWIDLAATLFFAALGIAAWRIDRAWGIFALAAIAIPIATGTLLSMPRFGAVIFPFYLLLAEWSRTRARQTAVYGVSLVLAFVFITRFVTWRWIA